MNSMALTDGTWCKAKSNDSFRLKVFHAAVLFVCGALLYCSESLALEPPDPAEIEHLRRTGELSERQRAAEALGNHRFNPELVEKAKRKLQKVKNDYLGIDQHEPEPFAPPPSWRGLQTTGNVKLLTLLIAFSDYPPTNTQSYIHSNLFGRGDPARYPYESLAAYYTRSSYGQLAISGNTIGWYTTAYARSEVPQTTSGREDLIKEALNYYNSTGHDFTQYDNDGDGDIDYLIIIWTGPNNGWANFWWGYYTGFSDGSYTIDGKTIDRISWQWESNPIGGIFNPRVVIHETGHALGVPDYYDYDSTVGPLGGVGGLDMMHGNMGDHNCFSKWMLDWLTPTYVPFCETAMPLRTSGEYPDAVMVFPGAGSDDLFSEYFMVQNRYRAGNDDTPEMPGNGLIIWHVDATLDASGASFLYDNSFTSHKLLRLMEADGLEEIESSGYADAEDYYIGGDEFGPNTIPNSSLYSGAASDVGVANISAVSPQMTVSVGASSVCWSADGSDLAMLAADYGRVGCSGNCHWDFDSDGNVDEADLAYFASIFGGANSGQPGILLPPVLLSPAGGAILDNGCTNFSNPEEWHFDWSDVTGASKYHLYVIHQGAAYPVIDTEVSLSEYSYSSIGYISDTNRWNWSWKVRSGKESGEWSEWSEVRYFDVEPVNTDCP